MEEIIAPGTPLVSTHPDRFLVPATRGLLEMVTPAFVSPFSCCLLHLFVLPRKSSDLFFNRISGSEGEFHNKHLDSARLGIGEWRFKIHAAGKRFLGSGVGPEFCLKHNKLHPYGPPIIFVIHLHLDDLGIIEHPVRFITGCSRDHETSSSDFAKSLRCGRQVHSVQFHPKSWCRGLFLCAEGSKVSSRSVQKMIINNQWIG